MTSKGPKLLFYVKSSLDYLIPREFWQELATPILEPGIRGDCFDLMSYILTQLIIGDVMDNIKHKKLPRKFLMVATSESN